LGPASASPLNAIIAVGDTISVTLHATTLTGTPVTSFDSVQYLFNYQTDTQYVQVSSTGIVTGKKPTDPGNPVVLGILAFRDGAVVYDATVIQVTQTALSRAMLSIQPIPPDSARWQASLAKFLTPVIMDPVTGDTISGVALRLEFGAEDSAGVRCSNFPVTNRSQTIADEVVHKSNCEPWAGGDYTALNGFIGLRPETIWIHATVVAYGMVLHDSLQFVITYPQNSNIYFYPGGMAVGQQGAWLNAAVVPGGSVAFGNYFDPSYGTSINVTFDHPDAATAPPGGVDTTSGNIVGLTGQNAATRRFLSAGTYGYTYTIATGVAPFKGVTGRGTITVQ